MRIKFVCLLALIIGCNPVAVEVAVKAIEVAANVVEVLDFFDQHLTTFQTSTNRAQEYLDESNQMSIEDRAIGWEDQWKITSKSLDLLRESFEKINHQITVYFDSLDEETRRISNEGLRQQEFKKNKDILKKWERVKKKIQQQLKLAAQIEQEGRDVRQVLTLAAMRNQLDQKIKYALGIHTRISRVNQELRTLVVETKNLIDGGQINQHPDSVQVQKLAYEETQYKSLNQVHSSTSQLGEKKIFDGTYLSYTSKVSKSEVERLGSFLITSKFTDGSRKDVILDRVGKGYIFKLIFNPKLTLNDQWIDTFKAFASQLSSLVFQSTPVEIHLLDDTYKLIKVIPFNSQLGEKKIFDGTYLFYTSKISKSEVERLGTFLITSKFTDGSRKDVILDRIGKSYLFKMIFNPKLTLNNQ